jgi:hypothetical protein
MVNTERQNSSEGLRTIVARYTDSITERIKDGSLPLAAGTSLFLGALRSRGRQPNTKGRLLAGAALIGIGIRQRRHHRATAEVETLEEEHGGTGTWEQRAESHQREENPRETTEPDVERKRESSERSIEFTEEQAEASAQPDLDTESAGDPRVEKSETTVDLSEAAMADEASEAAGPSSVQSQPTQTDASEPEETPEEDQEKAEDDHSAETDEGGEDSV